ATWDLEVDVVAVGSGGGGLIAAIVARDAGLRAAVLEKDARLGGGTAYSDGNTWIIANHHMKAAGVEDSREEGLAHLRARGRGRQDEAKAAAYADWGEEALTYVEQHTPLRFRMVPGYPDNRPQLPGAKVVGRDVAPDPPVMEDFLTRVQHEYPLLARIRPCP